jgi:TetR/AcrR family transcriptional regulator, transcriptional repressor for nem operon
MNRRHVREVAPPGGFHLLSVTQNCASGSAWVEFLTPYQLIGMVLDMAETHSSKMRFLDAVPLLIRSKGYAATTVDDLCEAAQLTKGSFFHHFSSKEQLVQEAAKHFDESCRSFFAASAYHSAKDPVDRILAYVDLRIAMLEEELPSFTCLFGTMVQETYRTHPGIREICERSICGHAQTLEKDIAEALRHRKVEHDWTARSLALHMQAVLQGAFILAKATGGPEVAAESIRHLKRYLELLFGKSKRKRSHNL